ncbi:hypothetical protein E2C01_017211 [Portunus trituberculatus]|uniref:Uncharacterized protein n=1 Tax=Portunus trituberculatus TaxID=210409 RepID=A0A5B7DSU3_PORTR|nr:hypothetical protein [Portunus trituberculatus]
MVIVVMVQCCLAWYGDRGSSGGDGGDVNALLLGVVVAVVVAVMINRVVMIRLALIRPKSRLFRHNPPAAYLTQPIQVVDLGLYCTYIQPIQ